MEGRLGFLAWKNLVIAIAKQNAKASMPTIKYLSATEVGVIVMIAMCFMPYPNLLAI